MNPHCFCLSKILVYPTTTRSSTQTFPWWPTLPRGSSVPSSQHPLRQEYVRSQSATGLKVPSQTRLRIPPDTESICRWRIGTRRDLCTNWHTSCVTFSLTPGDTTGLSNLVARWPQRFFYVAWLDSGSIVLPPSIGRCAP
jgi:hypothetical protein